MVRNRRKKIIKRYHGFLVYYAYICLPYPVGRMSFPCYIYFFFNEWSIYSSKSHAVYLFIVIDYAKIDLKSATKPIKKTLPYLCYRTWLIKLRQFRTFLSIIFTRVCWGVEASPFCLWFRSLHIVRIVFENIIWFWVACCCLGLCLRGFEQCLASGWCSYVCKIPLLSCSQIWKE